MTDRKEFIDEVAAQMKKWDDDLVVLENRTVEANTELKSDLKQKLDELKQKKDEFRNKLEELQSSGKDAWDLLNNEIKKSYENIKEAFEESKKIMKN
ncbi:MAG: hypothetical protein QY331_15285 [Melioribacteraceae bacterium]|jgi:DNA anti-recombination protein RmuC|nr:hypothetical protein [Melioribacteraceae bacterium]RJP61149.1 MAG: hypothetical protein C4543_03860 [Ignavibacteriales bacterium]WKZ69324.1 MAG: hypothetical protein QY331_15285 [Melioribacteraceae bacterium]